MGMLPEKAVVLQWFYEETALRGIQRLPRAGSFPPGSCGMLSLVPVLLQNET